MTDKFLLTNAGNVNMTERWSVFNQIIKKPIHKDGGHVSTISLRVITHPEHRCSKSDE